LLESPKNKDLIPNNDAKNVASKKQQLGEKDFNSFLWSWWARYKPGATATMEPSSLCLR